MRNTGQRMGSDPDDGRGGWSPVTALQLAAALTELLSAMEASTPSVQLGALVLCVGAVAFLGKDRSH